MNLKGQYSLFSPFYDRFLEKTIETSRQKSLSALPHSGAAQQILINGVGTGLDLPFLPPEHCYTGLDLTPAMLRRAVSRANQATSPRHFLPLLGDAQRLPFPDHSFDHAVLHLILAVVPDAFRCLAETARVIKPGGMIFIFDKFLHAEASPLKRKLLSLLSDHFLSRFDVVFEEVLQKTPSLELICDEPALHHGWFRLIRLMKR